MKLDPRDLTNDQFEFYLGRWMIIHIGESNNDTKMGFEKVKLIGIESPDSSNVNKPGYLNFEQSDGKTLRLNLFQVKEMELCTS